MKKRSQSRDDKQPAEHSDARRIGPTHAADKLFSRRILTLSNILKRAAGLRYRRLLDLPSGDWGVIAGLGHGRPQTLNELSDTMGWDKTQASRIVSRLVTRGLVVRRTSPDNNREILISLTETGGRTYETILAAGTAVNATLMAGLSSAERKVLFSHIEQMTKRAHKLLILEQDLSSTHAAAVASADPKD